MISELSRSRRMAYAVEPGDLRKLDEILGSVGPRTYQVCCRDGTKFTLNDVGEIEWIPLARRKVIRSITALAGEYFGTPSVLVKLESHPSLDNAAFEIRASEETRTYLHDKLDQWFSSVATWYSGFRPIINVLGNVFWVSVGALSTMQLYLGVMSGPDPAISKLGWDSKLLVATAILAFVLGVVGIAILFSRLMRYFFPASIFAIGYGGKEYKRMQIVRGFMGGTVILGLALGVAANFLYAHLAK